MLQRCTDDSLQRDLQWSPHLQEGLVGISASCHHKGALELGQLDGNVPHAPSSCMDQHPLPRLDTLGLQGLQWTPVICCMLACSHHRLGSSWQVQPLQQEHGMRAMPVPVAASAAWRARLSQHDESQVAPGNEVMHTAAGRAAGRAALACKARSHRPGCEADGGQRCSLLEADAGWEPSQRALFCGHIFSVGACSRPELQAQRQTVYHHAQL